MEHFRVDGHLSDETLDALIHSDPMDGLARLEISEHLSFCDECLQRYTNRLALSPLLRPETSCQRTLWLRVRARSLRLAASRYATAAAAVALALSLLWSAPQIDLSGRLQERRTEPILSETSFFRVWPQELGETLDQAMGDFSGLLHHLGRTFSQGGSSS